MNTKTKKKLFLIQPQFFNPELDRNKSTLPPLGLAYVAAYTPDNWDIEILDEQVEEFRFVDCDLVGMTTTTLNINRCYELAALYKEKGIPVVMGGIHVSLVPDEAEKFCDSVVIGDAEGIWQEVLSDFEKGTLRKRYNGPILELNKLKIPRRDLIKSRYIFGSISTSRGCPFKCSFCAIHNFYKDTYRLRPVDEVIEELKTLENRVVFFTDGNLYGYNKKSRERFIAICEKMIEERKNHSFTFKEWMAYASVNILDDNEALEKASKAGCINLFIGFESINPDSLKEMHKSANINRVKHYETLTQNATKHGIMVTAEIIFGFDSDTHETVKQTWDFIKKADFDMLRLQLLQPIPGTETWDKMEKENRLLLKKFPQDWLKPRDDFVMGSFFTLKNMDPVKLKQQVIQMGSKFFSIFNIIRRSVRAFFRYKSLFLSIYYIVLSLKARKSYSNYKFKKDI